MVAPLLKGLYRSAVTFDQEFRKVVEFMGRGAPESGKPRRVLEVGCGYGRYLRALSGSGFDVTGVDVNPELVSANRQADLPCLTVEQFAQTQDTYDVLLLSHVIEHFTPAHLLEFMDGYLDRLAPGGYLVIATPLLSPYFYHDFDHVRPYHPVGLEMVFGAGNAQVQYQSRNKLVLRDLWFRRSPFRLSYARSTYIRTSSTRLVQAVEFLLALLFRLSWRRIGRADGWVGLYQKVARS
jgi:SAM-dependent methyltransferase